MWSNGRFVGRESSGVVRLLNLQIGQGGNKRNSVHVLVIIILPVSAKSTFNQPTSLTSVYLFKL